MMWLFPISFGVIQNSYFGWNLFPKSDAELITDGLFLVLCALAYAKAPA